MALGLLFWLAPPAQSQTPGSLDTSFFAGLQDRDNLRVVIARPNGAVLAAGRRTVSSLDPDGNLVLDVYGLVAGLAPDGALDPAFSSGGRATNPLDLVPLITAAVLEPAGGLVMGGHFTAFDSPARLYLARLTAAGGLDLAFQPAANKNVEALARREDGRLVVGGAFTALGGKPRNFVGRLNADGSVDTSFTTAAGGPNATVWTVAAQPDGNVLIGGDFATVDGVARRSVARLDASGALDATFDPGSGANNTVLALALQPDGKVVIAGSFTSVNGVACGRVARLNANGGLDTTFDAGLGASATVYALTRQPDGRLLVGGNFTSFAGQPAGRVVRLEASGAVDTMFAPGTGANTQVRCFAVQADGKVLVAGNFTDFSGQPVNGLVRLNGDATAPDKPAISRDPIGQSVWEGDDAAFTVVASGAAPLSYQWRRDGEDIPSATQPTLALRAVGPAAAGAYTVLVSNSAGAVTSAAAALTVLPRPRLALARNGAAVQLTLTGAAAKLYAVEYATTLRPPILWQPLTNFVLVGTTGQFADLTAGGADARFYRATVSR